VLSFLLDENLSHEIAHQLNKKRPDLPIVSVHHWREGLYLHASDREIILAASAEGKTLVTYDLATIPLLLIQLQEEGHSHGGVILINQRTIASHDYGQIMNALIDLWEKERDWNWTDQVVFLQRSKP
jgi:hypothetical protein